MRDLVNPYDLCITNKMVHSNQMTIMWHVDDVKSSHVYPRVNNLFITWLNKEYGQIGEVKSSRGKKHNYLGMTLDYSVDGEVKVNLTNYINKMVTIFPQVFSVFC